MKNNFTVSISFNDVPLYSYEWENIAIISGIKVIRVKTEVMRDVLTYKTKIFLNTSIVILSDCKTSVVLRLDKASNVVKYSFPTFEDDLNINEFACSLKCEKLDYTLLNEKLEYNNVLCEETKMKEYVLKTLKKVKDEFENKYLYYLFFNEIEGYSKEKLVDFIQKDKPGNFKKLYDYLVAK